MRRDDAYLLDILIAAQKAIQFTSGIDREEFEENEIIQNAVIRPLEIIGEASGKLSKEFRKAHKEIPWGDMIDLRNRLIHEYFNVNYGAVWDTIKKDLPEFIKQVAPLIPPKEEES